MIRKDTAPETRARQTRLLSMLVRCPAEGYKTLDLLPIVYADVPTNRRSTKLRSDLMALGHYPIFQDDVSLGILDYKARYLPMPLEVVK